MAENLEKAPFFSIESTIEQGMGSPELLKDLLDGSSVSDNPDEISPVEEEEKKEEKPAKKPAPPKKKEEKKEEKEEEKEEKEEEMSPLSSFLEEDENEKTEEKKETPESGEEKPEPSIFTSLSKELFKLGVFTKDDDDEEEEISSPEDFLTKFHNEKKKGAMEVIQNFIGQYGEDYQNAFDAIYVKGVSPKEYFALYNNIVDYAKLDMTKEQNQESVVRQALTDQGFEEDDVNAEIEKLKNYGDLEQTAARHHKVLVKKEALKLQQLEQKAEQEQQQKAALKSQYIQNVQGVLQEKVKAKEFDGIPINPKLATELQDFLLVDKWKTSSGETLTDFDKAILELKRPENHAMKVKIALLLKVLEKDPTLSTIQKSGVTKKTDELFGEVSRHAQKSTKTAINKPISWFNQ